MPAAPTRFERIDREDEDYTPSPSVETEREILKRGYVLGWCDGKVQATKEAEAYKHVAATRSRSRTVDIGETPKSPALYVAYAPDLPNSFMETAQALHETIREERFHYVEMNVNNGPGTPAIRWWNMEPANEAARKRAYPAALRAAQEGKLALRVIEQYAQAAPEGAIDQFRRAIASIDQWLGNWPTQSAVALADAGPFEDYERSESFLRRPSRDAYEFRFSPLGIQAPGYNARIQF